METLVNLAQKKKHTVIFTIHQPRSNIFQMFDKLLLLSQVTSIYDNFLTSPTGKGSIFWPLLASSGLLSICRTSSTSPCESCRFLMYSIQFFFLLSIFFLVDVVAVDSRSPPDKIRAAQELIDKYRESEFHLSSQDQVLVILYIHLTFSSDRSNRRRLWYRRSDEKYRKRRQLF